MTREPRVALKSDIPQLRDLIPRSSFELQRNTYTREQIEAALGPVFGVDEQLIEDRTYYVVEECKKIVACGGWSFHKSLYAKFSYTSVERYEIPLNGAKPITVVKMTRAFR